MVPAGPTEGDDPDSASRLLIVTPGDPRGIGPEVACRALAERARAGAPVRAVLVGDRAAIDAAAEREGLRGFRCIDPGDHDEPVEAAAIRYAVGAIRAGQAAALVTGPVNKARLASRGFPFTGHTDFLGHLCGVDHPVMAFVGGQLMVALATVHLPLRRVADALTIDGIAHTIHTADRALRDQLGLRRRRIAVCGVNPHAGDGGLLGQEEIEVIGPAVERCRAEGVDARGPISAEAAFLAASRGETDLVVAMYHDQGLAPLKLVDFGQSVNWTLGLPMIRTSVEHGTAYDIAGHRKADAASMHAALALAERLVGSAASGR